VLIGRVLPDSPAATAGLRSAGRTSTGWDGDIIVSIDGRPVRDVDEYYRVLDRYKAGESVTVRIVRGGRQIEVPVTLREGQ